MIKSVIKNIHPITGIIHILITTEEEWVAFIVKSNKDNKLEFSFHNKEDVTMYNAPINYTTEFVDMPDDYYSSLYKIFEHQTMNQIEIVCIPTAMIGNYKRWMKYGT